MTSPKPDEHAIAESKRAAAVEAVASIASGMVVGLGAGSTAALATEHLATLVTAGTLRDLVCIPCSRLVERQARALGLPLATLSDRPQIDLTIDGADEVDPALNLIKGAGGALLYEEMVAQASRREIIIVDERKLSPRLGAQVRLPVEVFAYGWRAEELFLRGLGAEPEAAPAGRAAFRHRRGKFHSGFPFRPHRRRSGLAQTLDARAGIAGHGLFVNLASEVIVALQPARLSPHPRRLVPPGDSPRVARHRSAKAAAAADRAPVAGITRPTVRVSDIGARGRAPGCRHEARARPPGAGTTVQPEAQLDQALEHLDAAHLHRHRRASAAREGGVEQARACAVVRSSSSERLRRRVPPGARACAARAGGRGGTDQHVGAEARSGSTRSRRARLDAPIAGQAATAARPRRGRPRARPPRAAVAGDGRLSRRSSTPGSAREKRRTRAAADRVASVSLVPSTSLPARHLAQREQRVAGARRAREDARSACSTKHAARPR